MYRYDNWPEKAYLHQGETSPQRLTIFSHGNDGHRIATIAVKESSSFNQGREENKLPSDKLW
jgi:hypothetical protein